MSELKQEELEEKKDLPSESEQKEGEDGADEKELESQEQDPLKQELEKVKKNPVHSKKDKLLFSRKKIDEQLKELGEDVPENDTLDEDDDSKPVTVGMLKKLQQKNATETALELAEEQIENDIELELVKYHIENTIRSTGNPTEDLRLARSIVNASKNSKIIGEIKRKPEAKNHSSSGGGTRVVKNEEILPEEEPFMKPPFNMTKAQILAARK